MLGFFAEFETNIRRERVLPNEQVMRRPALSKKAQTWSRPRRPRMPE